MIHVELSVQGTNQDERIVAVVRELEEAGIAEVQVIGLKVSSVPLPIIRLTRPDGVPVEGYGVERTLAILKSLYGLSSRKTANAS